MESEADHVRHNDEAVHMNKRRTLRQLLESERPLIMPDAYDGLSARLIQTAGFKAVQCSGYSMALADRCIQEAKLGFENNLERTKSIVQSVTVPVMADGEDGFGPPSRVHRAVQAFIEVGIAGINIEDQVLPPPNPKQVVALSLMREKIRAAREAAESKRVPDLVINGRTDALSVAVDRKRGLREAIERGNHYVKAGADLIFVTGVATLDEVRVLVQEIQGPVSIAAGLPSNIYNLSIKGLRECGVARVSLPTIAVFSALQAMKRTLLLIRQSDDFVDVLEHGFVCTAEDVSNIFAP